MSNLQVFNQTITNQKTQEYLQSVLNERKGSFMNNMTALVSNNKALQECEPTTLLFAGLKATALNMPLDANLGFCYVIPYKNNKEGKTEAQFQIGYKGMIQLAIRSGQFSNINVTDVREGEVGEFDLLTGEIKFVAKPNRMDLPVVGYVAYFRLTNGFSKSLYMTREEVDAHGQRYSQTYASKNDYVRKSSKWATDFDAMAKKTVLKLLLSRYAPLSVEMQQAVTFDQSVMRKENEPTYVDNEPQEVQADEIDVNALIKQCAGIESKFVLGNFKEINSEIIESDERLKQMVEKKEKELKDEQAN